MNPPILVIDSLSKCYGEKRAVDNVSITVQPGEIFGLLGPNGAGKSTTIECVLGTLKKDSGSASILGLDPIRQRKQLFNQVGVQFQASHYHGFIKVKELCELTASLYSNVQSWRSLLEQFELTDKTNQFVADLSGGERQKLTLALTLIPKPKIVFLDELTTGLDPHARREVWQLLKDQQKQGLTIFLTSHYMDEVEILCDRIAVIQGGKLVQQGTVSDLIVASGHERLEDAYLQWVAA